MNHPHDKPGHGIGSPPPGSGYYPPPPGHHGGPHGNAGFPPPHWEPGHPRRSGSKTLLVVVGSVLATLALLVAALLIADPWEWFSGRSAAEDSRETAASNSPLIGRWCVRRGWTRFDPDGSLADAADYGEIPVGGSWQELPGARISMTANGRTVAATYRISGDTLTMTSSKGITSTYRRCS